MIRETFGTTCLPLGTCCMQAFCLRPQVLCPSPTVDVSLECPVPEAMVSSHPAKAGPAQKREGSPPSRPTCMVLRYSSPGLQEAPRSHEQGEACPEWPPCPCPALLCPLPGSVSHRSVNPGPVSLCLLFLLFVLHLQSSLALLFGSPTELRSLVRGCAGDLQADISEPAGFWHRVRRCQAGDSKLQDYIKMVDGP